MGIASQYYHSSGRSPPTLSGRRLPRLALWQTRCIRAQGLTKIYAGGVGGDVVAVDEIELEINSGEIFGLLGPNGAGKTTTVGMLTTRVVAHEW